MAERKRSVLDRFRFLFRAPVALSICHNNLRSGRDGQCKTMLGRHSADRPLSLEQKSAPPAFGRALVSEATAGFEPAMKVLQTSALPLGYVALKRRLPAVATGNQPLERKTRFELATLSLARRCSTTEPLPLFSGLAARCRSPDLNWGHLDFQSSALPTDLPRHSLSIVYNNFASLSNRLSGPFNSIDNLSHRVYTKTRYEGKMRPQLTLSCYPHI